MTYEIRTEKQPDHLVVVIEGVVEPGMAGEVAENVIRACRSDPSRWLLVDVRALDIQVEPAETLQLVDSYADIAKGLRMKTAVVCEAKNADALRFYEMVTQNRGFPTELFVDVDLALSWLRS